MNGMTFREKKCIIYNEKDTPCIHVKELNNKEQELKYNQHDMRNVLCYYLIITFMKSCILMKYIDKESVITL